MPNPALGNLAGIVGAVDGGQVSRLISYAIREGTVETDLARTQIGLSPLGWAAIERPKAAALPFTEQLRAATEALVPDPIVVPVIAHCNQCGGDRNAYRRGTHKTAFTEGEVSWSSTYDILECCGCGGISFRREQWCSEWDEFEGDENTGTFRMVRGVETTSWPPPTGRKRPSWAPELSDEIMRRVFDEVYKALNSEMVVLASVGIRTLLDRAMYLCVGDPKGGFGGKLDLMVTNGHIGKDERATLEIIIDAGNAAAHRGAVPSTSHLATIIDVAESLLHREFVLKPAASQVKAATPPRPGR